MIEFSLEPPKPITVLVSSSDLMMFMSKSENGFLVSDIFISDLSSEGLV
jgi:hypothetical protein